MARRSSQEATQPIVKSKASKSRGKRKLTDSQVLEIVQQFGAGIKRSVLARDFDLAHGTVTSIVTGRTYSWLTGIGAPADLAQAA